MSDFDENIHPATPQRHFDRLVNGVDLLVDGELSEADRRAMLLQLEHEPDGWRRCALAFLEAQCWKAELGQFVPLAGLDPIGPNSTEPQAAPAEAVSPARSNLSQAARGRRQSWRQHVATMLTIAASFLIALVVGMGLSGSWTGGPAHGPGSARDKGDQRDPVES